MAGIVTQRVAHDAGPNQHCRIKVMLAGVEHVIETGNDEIVAHDFNLQRFVKDLVHYLSVVRGVPLSQIAGRVVLGEEATNVRVNDFFGPGAAATMTNMRGAATQVYANCLPGLGGEPIVVNFEGVTEVRVELAAQFVGTGPWQVRIIRDSNSEVFYESPSLTQTGERALSTGWIAKPAGFDGEVILRSQMRSVTAADDPVMRRLTLLTR
jgi:hypothetical protein